MPADALAFIDVVLSWTRAAPGKTAILRREGDGGWDELGRVEGAEFKVTGLHPERSYSFAAAPVLGDGGLAPESDWETVRVAPMADEGRPDLPATPAGFACAQDGPVVNCVWQAAADGLTASYEIREGATWEDGRLVAEDLRGTSYSFPWWASGDRTLHLKAIDRYERPCRQAATVEVSIIPLDDHVDANAWDQAAGSWPGTAIHMEEDGGDLRNEALPACFGAVAAPFGSFAGVPCFARFWPEGLYTTPIFNVGQLENERLEVDLVAGQPVPPELPFGACRRPALGARRTRDGILLPLGTRGFGARNSWQLTPLPPPDIQVEIDTSPAAGGPFDGWRPYAPGHYAFWRCRFRVRVKGDGLRFVQIPNLVLRHRRRNKKAEGVADLTTGDTVVTFATPFVLAPVVTFAPVDFVGAFKIVTVSPTQVAFCAYELPNPSGLYDPGPYEPPNHNDANTPGVPDTYIHPPYTPAPLDLSFATYTQKTSGQVHWHALGP